MTFPPISPSATNWLDLVIAQGKAIKQALLSNYPLAFSDELGDSSNFATVAPIKININLGAKPINRTTCPRPPAGLKKSTKKLIEQLFKEGVIRRWDKPSTWCGRCHLLSKSGGSPRLVVKFRGLNSCSNRVGYPFSSSHNIHLDVENGTFLFIRFDLIQAYYQL